jgi:hypothetical protein
MPRLGRFIRGNMNISIEYKFLNSYYYIFFIVFYFTTLKSKVFLVLLLPNIQNLRMI